MRIIVLAVVLSLTITRSVVATSCVSVTPDVRRAAIVGLGRYAGNRTFMLESILRTRGERPAKVVAPEDWRSSPCSPPEPVAGTAYLILLYQNGAVRYVQDEESARPLAQLEALHVETAESILDLLSQYAEGVVARDPTAEWLGTAVFDAHHDRSFSDELLTAAEELLSMITVSEACHSDVVRELRRSKLPRALRGIAKAVPAAETEDQFVHRRIAGVDDATKRQDAEDEAIDEWDDIMFVIDAQLGTLSEELRKLSWCDHDQYGW